MTRSWERELRKLRAVDAPPDTRRRIDEGPSGDPFGGVRGTRQRVVAAVVALAVFAAAGAFAYAGFSDTTTDLVDDPGTTVGPATPEEPLVLSIRVDDRNGFDPGATVSYGGEERDLFCLSYTVTWVGGGGDGMMSNCSAGPALTVPVGTELEIVSDPEAQVDISPAHPTGARGGVYVTIDVTWPRNDVWRSAEASFQARLRVVEAAEPPANPSDDLLVGSGTVLQDGSTHPEFCLGGVLESLPPQCSGVPLRGWDWDAIGGEETAGGTTWGQATVTGRFEGATFVVASVGPYEPAPEEPYDFTPPCEEPDGGWIAPDPTRTSDDDRHAATRHAEAQPDHTASWISYLTPPTDDMEDPGPYVLVLGFTGDLDRHRREAAELWGGPLCVFEQERTYRELRTIQRQLEEVAAEVGAEMTFSSGDVVRNQVEMGVVVSSPELEQALAERFGGGAVRIVPALRAVV